MAMREGQIVTQRLKSFLEGKAHNKAEIARRAGLEPDELYAMLGNTRIMTADHFIAICKALNATGSEVVDYQD